MNKSSLTFNPFMSLAPETFARVRKDHREKAGSKEKERATRSFSMTEEEFSSDVRRLFKGEYLPRVK